jgi:uncharacterized protein with beta-barrel porin domain
MPIRFIVTIRFLFLTAVAIWGFGATGAYAVTSNPRDPLFCQPNEGVNFLIVNGGAGVFTANSDCFGGNPANNTQTTITTSNGGTLVTTDHSDYVYTPSSLTFTGTDQFSIHVTTVFNAAGGPGSAGGTSFGSSGPATLNITLNVIPGNVTLLDTPNNAILIPVPAGSITGCGTQASEGNAGQGPPASAVAGCVTSIARGSGGTVAPSHGTLTTSGNTLLYTPTAGFAGIDTFTYQALGPNTDGSTALSSGNVTVTMDVFHTIDTAVPSYNASALGVTLAPIFNGGTLLLDQAGATYSQGFTLNNSITNTIDQAGHSATFSGVFSDATTGGNLTIANSGSGGSVTFSGTNTYTGTTTINSGASLIVNGSIATSSAVNVSGALSGTGTVGATTVNTGGILAPGSGVAGTSLMVSGSLAFASGAMYVVMLNPTTASFAQVTGTATLGGSVQAFFAPGSYLGKQYTILQSAGLGGTTFASLTTNNIPAGFLASLSYTPTSVLLNLTGSLPTAGLSTNQTNVAGALNKFFNGGGALPPSFITIFGLTDGNLQAALTQASGETATGTQQTTFDAMNLFMGLLTDPFVDGRGATGAVSPAAPPAFAEEDSTASSYTNNGQKRSGSERDAYGMMTKAPMMPPVEQRWSVWAAGFGGSQTTDGNATLGSNSVTSRIAGTAVGADYLVSPFTLAGFAMAGGATSFSVANSGGGHSDLFQVGAFVRHTVGPAYVAATLAYGWQDVTTNRTVTITGIDQLQARFNANAYSGRVEGGYRFVMPGTGTPWSGMPAWTAMPWAGGLGITPYAAAQFTTFQLPAYAESAVSGTNNFALSFGSQSVTDPRSELGVRTDKSYALTDSILTLRTRFAWAHDYDPNRAVGATFQSLPGASFVVNGAAMASDSALTTASAEMKWRNGWSTAATFEGEFSNVTSSYGGKAVVRYAW